MQMPRKFSAEFFWILLSLALIVNFALDFFTNGGVLKGEIIGQGIFVLGFVGWLGYILRKKWGFALILVYALILTSKAIFITQNTIAQIAGIILMAFIFLTRKAMK